MQKIHKIEIQQVAYTFHIYFQSAGQGMMPLSSFKGSPKEFGKKI
jgi:hypothetical protein